MVPSVVDPDRYRVDPTGEAVVFINPVPTKGVDIAFALAEQRPDVPFEFRESWHLPKAVAQEVHERCAALGNVDVRPEHHRLRVSRTGEPVSCSSRTRTPIALGSCPRHR